MQFDNCGSLCASVMGLLFSTGIDVELGNTGLDITLVLYVQKTSLEVLIEGQFLDDVSPYWWLSASYAS